MWQRKKIVKGLQIQKKTLPLHRFSEEDISRRSPGEVAEWSIAAVLKTVVPRGTRGSNPCLSANNGCKSSVCKIYIRSFQLLPSYSSFFRAAPNIRVYVD